MAMVTLMPFAGRDDPIYKGGPTLYTPRLNHHRVPPPPAQSETVDTPPVLVPQEKAAD